MNYPRDQIEFEKMFSNEKQCFDYLVKIRWAQGFVCPKCKCHDHWIIANNLIKCKNCKYQASATRGTIFHRSKKSLIVWFRAIWWIINQQFGVNALELKKILGLGSYRTAWTWLHKLRRLMIIPEKNKLSGTVEVGAIFISSQKKEKNGSKEQILVIIGVEINKKATNRIKFSIIPDISSKSLTAFICSNIKSGSRIVTADKNNYHNVKALGYQHKIENKNIIFNGINILPNVHKIASVLERWLLGIHQHYVSKNKLEYYLDELTFLYNHKTIKSRGLLFFLLIEQGIRHVPVLYNEIINSSNN